jgi:PAS domain S-box-containing protein
VPAVTYVDTVSEPVQSVFVSPQIRAMLGFTPEEWVGDPDLWWDHLDPAFLPEAHEAVTRHATGEPFDVEYRFRAKDGSWHWIRDQALVVTDDDGTVRFSQGVMTDITDEKLAEEQLRDAEQRYRAIVEHIPAVVYLDPLEWPAETLYVSPELGRMLGIDAEEWARDVDSVGARDPSRRPRGRRAGVPLVPGAGGPVDPRVPVRRARRPDRVGP